MSCYEFEVPFPPSGNTYYRRSGHHIYLSPAGREYKANICEIIKKLGLHEEKLDQRLRIVIGVSAKTRRKYDLDNRLKPLLDGLQDSGLFVDDEQIDRLTIFRLPHGENKAQIRLEILD
jgi:crossover junction endodeoxyribonuclease RusA